MSESMHIQNKSNLNVTEFYRQYHAYPPGWGAGGTHIGRWYRDVLPSRFPFQATFQLWRPTFSSSFPAPEPPLPLFEKNLTFQDQFLPILTKFVAAETQILAKIYYRDPHLQANKISSGDPIFENPGGTFLPKFLSTNSPGVYPKKAAQMSFTRIFSII